MGMGCTILGLMMSFLGLCPRTDVINPQMVQSPYPLRSHGTTVTITSSLVGLLTKHFLQHISMHSFTFQGCSHQIWNGQVSGACVSTQQLRGSGGMLPQKMFGIFKGYEITSESIFKPKWCFLGGQTWRWSLTCMNICPLRHVALVLAIWLFANLKATPFADETCETYRLFGWTESCWKTQKRFFRTVRGHLICFNMSPALCVPWAFTEHWPYSGHQASHGWGRKWCSCWNWTNWTAAWLWPCIWTNNIGYHYSTCRTPS